MKRTLEHDQSIAASVAQELSECVAEILRFSSEGPAAPGESFRKEILTKLAASLQETAYLLIRHDGINSDNHAIKMLCGDIDMFTQDWCKD